MEGHGSSGKRVMESGEITMSENAKKLCVGTGNIHCMVESSGQADNTGNTMSDNCRCGLACSSHASSCSDHLPSQLIGEDTINKALGLAKNGTGTSRVSDWKMMGNSLNHVLQLTTVNFDLRTQMVSKFWQLSDFYVVADDVKEVISDRVLEDIERVMTFTVHEMPSRTHQFGGYAKMDDSGVVDVYKELQKNYSGLVQLLDEYATSKPQPYTLNLMRATGAFNFIRDVITFLVTTKQQTEVAFQHLFQSFARIVGLSFETGATTGDREMWLYGKHVRGGPALRACVDLPDTRWAAGDRQTPMEDIRKLRIQRHVTAIAEVKSTPLNDEAGGRNHAEGYLGQLIGELLGELRSRQSHILDPTKRELLGILVISTRVQFVLLKTSSDLQERYDLTDIPRCMVNEAHDGGQAYITNPLDFMKRNDRHMLFKMLRHISKLSQLK